MNNSFERDDLAEEVEEMPAADEAADETVDDAEVEAAQRVAAEQTTREDDELLPDIADEPMPKLHDPDIYFDENKLEAKTSEWISRKASKALTQAQLRAQIDTRIQAFRKSHPDFDDVVVKNRVLIENQLSPVAGLAVASSKDVAALLYEFGRNPAYAMQVARMPPAQQLLQVGKLKAKIASRSRATATTRDADQGSAQRQVRKGPISREQELQGGESMNDFARRSRNEKKVRRPTYFR